MHEPGTVTAVPRLVMIMGRIKVGGRWLGDCWSSNIEINEFSVGKGSEPIEIEIVLLGREVVMVGFDGVEIVDVL